MYPGYGRAQPSSNRIAGVFVKAPGAAALLAVADACALERAARLCDCPPIEVLETDIVGHSNILTELSLREPDQRAMHGLRAHRLGARARTDLVLRAGERPNANEIQANLHALDDF